MLFSIFIKTAGRQAMELLAFQERPYPAEFTIII